MWLIGLFTTQLVEIVATDIQSGLPVSGNELFSMSHQNAVGEMLCWPIKHATELTNVTRLTDCFPLIESMSLNVVERLVSAGRLWNAKGVQFFSESVRRRQNNGRGTVELSGSTGGNDVYNLRHRKREFNRRKHCECYDCELHWMTNWWRTSIICLKNVNFD